MLQPAEIPLPEDSNITGDVIDITGEANTTIESDATVEGIPQGCELPPAMMPEESNSSQLDDTLPYEEDEKITPGAHPGSSNDEPMRRCFLRSHKLQRV